MGSKECESEVMEMKREDARQKTRIDEQREEEHTEEGKVQVDSIPRRYECILSIIGARQRVEANLKK